MDINTESSEIDTERSEINSERSEVFVCLWEYNYLSVEIDTERSVDLIVEIKYL
jgi:hypothetical protein